MMFALYSIVAKPLPSPDEPSLQPLEHSASPPTPSASAPPISFDSLLEPPQPTVQANKYMVQLAVIAT